MHARIVMMRLFAVTGMVLDLLPDFGREVALSGARSAACFPAAAACAAALMLRDLLEHLVQAFARLFDTVLLVFEI